MSTHCSLILYIRERECMGHGNRWSSQLHLYNRRCPRTMSLGAPNHTVVRIKQCFSVYVDDAYETCTQNCDRWGQLMQQHALTARRMQSGFWISADGLCSRPGGTSMPLISDSMQPDYVDRYPIVHVIYDIVFFLTVCGSWGVIADALARGSLATGQHSDPANFRRYAVVLCRQVSHN